MLGRGLLAPGCLTALILAATACATRSSNAEDTSPQEESGVLDGVYEFVAEVDVRNENDGANQTTVLSITGTVKFANGEYVALENDYSHPCRIPQVEPSGVPRTVVECPDLTLIIRRDGSPSVSDLSMRVNVSERRESRGGCSRYVERTCVEWSTAVRYDERRRSARLRVWKQRS